MVVRVVVWWSWFSVSLGPVGRYDTGCVVGGVVLFTWGCCRGLRRHLAFLPLFLLLLPLPCGLSPLVVVSVPGQCLLSSLLLSFLLPEVVLGHGRPLPSGRLSRWLCFPPPGVVLGRRRPLPSGRLPG